MFLYRSDEFPVNQSLNGTKSTNPNHRRSPDNCTTLSWFSKWLLQKGTLRHITSPLPITHIIINGTEDQIVLNLKNRKCSTKLKTPKLSSTWIVLHTLYSYAHRVQKKSATPLAAGDKVIKFWKVKVKGQGRCGRYVLYWALLVVVLLSHHTVLLYINVLQC